MIYNSLMTSRAPLGHFLIIAAATLWGTTGTSQALAPSGASSLTIGAMRIIVGSLPLLLLAIARGGFKKRTHWHLPTVLIAGLSTAAYQVLFFNGVRLAGVAIGTLVGIGSAPVFAGLLGVLFEKDQLTWRWFAATGMAIAGCTMLTTSGGEAEHANLPGLLLALGAGLVYAIFTLVNKRLLADHSADETMAVSFCLGALFLLPAILFNDMSWVSSGSGLIIVLHLGLVATGLSYALFGRGLRSVPVSTVGMLTLAEPLTAGMLGVLVLGERLTPLSVGGITLMFAGLAILTLHREG